MSEKPTARERAIAEIDRLSGLERHPRGTKIIRAIESAGLTIIDAAEPAKLRRIIAGLRRAVVVLTDWKRGRLGCGDNTEYSMYLSVRDRADAIRSSALNGEYRGKR